MAARRSGGTPRPGVGHAERHRAARAEGDAQADAAPLGELDGIAGEVDEDLPKPGRVADEARRQFGDDDGRDVEPLFLGTGRQQLDDAFHEPPHVERLRHEVEPPRFDAREVEHLVDQRGERAARGVDRLDIGLLLGIERRARQQFGHAEHAVEGGADLMADRREKTRLCMGGGLRLGARLAGRLHFPQLVGEFLLRLLDQPRPAPQSSPRDERVQEQDDPDHTDDPGERETAEDGGGDREHGARPDAAARNCASRHMRANP